MVPSLSGGRIGNTVGHALIPGSHLPPIIGDMSKIVGAIVSALLGAGVSMLFAKSSWQDPLLWAAGALAIYGLWFAAKFVYGRTPMGMDRRERQRREALEAASEAAASRPRITLRDVVSSGNGGAGIRIGKGGDVDMTAVRTERNRDGGIVID